jgi:plasmid maintenance system antidote protein VapI
MNSISVAMDSPGGRIDRLAREHGRAKYWIANQLGISQSYLSRLISGERPITAEMAQRLATLFDVPASTFLPEAPDA